MINVFKPLDDQVEPVEVEFACFGSPIFQPDAADLSQTAALEVAMASFSGLWLGSVQVDRLYSNLLTALKHEGW